MASEPSHLIIYHIASVTMADQVQTASTSIGAGAGSGASLSPEDPRKAQALEGYRKALKNHEDLSSNVKKCECNPVLILVVSPY